MPLLEVAMDMLREIPKQPTMRSSRRRNGTNELTTLGVEKEQDWQE